MRFMGGSSVERAEGSDRRLRDPVRPRLWLEGPIVGSPRRSPTMQDQPSGRGGAVRQPSTPVSVGNLREEGEPCFPSSGTEYEQIRLVRQSGENAELPVVAEQPACERGGPLLGGPTASTRRGPRSAGLGAPVAERVSSPRPSPLRRRTTVRYRTAGPATRRPRPGTSHRCADVPLLHLRPGQLRSRRLPTRRYAAGAYFR